MEPQSSPNKAETPATGKGTPSTAEVRTASRKAAEAESERAETEAEQKATEAAEAKAEAAETEKRRTHEHNMMRAELVAANNGQPLTMAQEIDAVAPVLIFPLLNAILKKYLG